MEGFYDMYDFDSVARQIGLQPSLTTMQSLGGIAGVLDRHPSQLSSGIFSRQSSRASSNGDLQLIPGLPGRLTTEELTDEVMIGLNGRQLTSQFSAFGDDVRGVRFQLPSPNARGGARNDGGASGIGSASLRLKSFNPNIEPEQWDRMVKKIAPADFPIAGGFPQDSPYVSRQSSASSSFGATYRKSVSSVVAAQNVGGYRPLNQNSAAYLATKSSTSSSHTDSDLDANDPMRPINVLSGALPGYHDYDTTTKSKSNKMKKTKNGKKKDPEEEKFKQAEKLKLYTTSVSGTDLVETVEFPKSGSEFDRRVVKHEAQVAMSNGLWNDVCLEKKLKGKDCTICNKRKNKQTIILQLEFQKKKPNYSGQLKLASFPNFQHRLCKARKDALETMVKYVY